MWFSGIDCDINLFSVSNLNRPVSKLALPHPLNPCLLQIHAEHKVEACARDAYKGNLPPWPVKPPVCPLPTPNHLMGVLGTTPSQAGDHSSSKPFRQSSFHKLIYYSFPTSPPLPHQLLKIFFKQKNLTAAGNQP